MESSTDGTNDMEGLTLGTSDTEGFKPKGDGGTPVRNMRVRFALPR